MKIATETEPQYDNTFAFKMLNELAFNTDDENLVYSPFSISVALAMTYAGARNETEREMANTLHFNPSQKEFHDEFSKVLSKVLRIGMKSNQLQIANSLWAHEGFHFRDQYFKLIEHYYESALYKVDFEGDREAIRQEINSWVAERTNKLIKELIKPNILDEETRLVLVNAIYFLSEWLYAFDEDKTQKDVFYARNGKKETVPFMKMSRKLKYLENSRMQVLEKPYEGEHFSMIIVLPREDVDFAEFASKIGQEDYARIINSLNEREVDVSLPSFKVRTQLDLEKMLAQMGMPLAFSNRADFTGMSQKDDLKIDRVIHEAFVEVNEKGTEAAAATAVVMIRKTAVADPEPKAVFKADRPFLYFIKDNTTEAVLFVGRVDNPNNIAN